MKLAFIAPRFPEAGVIGGAETLLRNLAAHAASLGHEVHFLTTCARSHFTWANEIPAGKRQIDRICVHYFPVNEDRDIDRFLEIQGRISCEREVSLDEQRVWMDHNVNSRELLAYLASDAGAELDAILAGPYLFGLTWHAARVRPEKTWLVPCLHDECFAYLEIMTEMFRSVRGSLFNAEPEKELAARLYGLPVEGQRSGVVGMGMESFAADPTSFARKQGWGPETAYVLYCGRRELLKGTPLLLDYVNAFRLRTHRDVKLVLTGSGDIDPPPEFVPHLLDLGYVSEEEKHEVMAGATAFIHPSVNESFGIVLLEAWLAGTPALVHARSEVLAWQCRRSGGGLWFQSYPEFELMLTRLLDDPDGRKQMGVAGKTYVETEYTWARVGERMFEILKT